MAVIVRVAPRRAHAVRVLSSVVGVVVLSAVAMTVAVVMSVVIATPVLVALTDVVGVRLVLIALLVTRVMTPLVAVLMAKRVVVEVPMCGHMFMLVRVTHLWFVARE